MKRSTIFGLAAAIAMTAVPAMAQTDSPDAVWPATIPYTLTPSTDAPATDLSQVTVEFESAVVSVLNDWTTPAAQLENIATGELYNCYFPESTDGMSYTYTWTPVGGTTPVNIEAEGAYMLTLRRFYNNQSNQALPWIYAYYEIGQLPTVAYTLDPEPGVVEEISTISIDFYENKNIAFADNSRMPNVVLENVLTGDFWEGSYTQNTKGETNGWIYDIKFIDENDEVVTITEDGEYLLTIRGLYMTNEEGEEEFVQPIKAYYTIGAGASVAYTLDPEPGVVESISTIAIDFYENKNIAFADNSRMPNVVIENVNTGDFWEGSYTLNSKGMTEGWIYDITFLDEDGAATTITEDGEYILTIRGLYLSLEGNVNVFLQPITANYRIGEGVSVPYSLNPAPGEVEEISTISIDFYQNKNIAFVENSRMPNVVLENVNTGDFWEGSYILNSKGETNGWIYDIKFIDENDEVVTISERGEYLLTIRGLYLIGENDEQVFITEPIVANYTIGYGSTVAYTLNPAPGKVEEISTISIDFYENKNIAFAENSRMANVVLEDLNTGDFWEGSYIMNTKGETNGWIYDIKFLDENEEVVTITEDGDYLLTIRGLYLIGENEEQIFINPITANYTIGDGVSVAYTLNPAPGEVEEISTISIDFYENKNIAFAENSRMPNVVLENVNTGDFWEGSYTMNTKGETNGWIYDIKFLDENEEAVTITEIGEYLLTIRGLYLIGENDEQIFVTAPITATYTISYPQEYVLTPANNEEVDVITNVVLEFPETNMILVAENSKTALATLINNTTGNEWYCYTAERLTKYETEGIAYQFNFYDEEDNYVPEISEDGVYTFAIPAGVLAYGENDDDAEPLPGITATYYVGNATSVATNMASDRFEVYTINGVKVISNGDINSLKSLNSGLYIINGKKVILRK